MCFAILLENIFLLCVEDRKLSKLSDHSRLYFIPRDETAIENRRGLFSEAVEFPMTVNYCKFPRGRFRSINRDPAKPEGWHRLVFPEYCLERFSQGTTCRPRRQTASKPQDAVITPESLKVKALALGGREGGGQEGEGGPRGERAGSPLGEAERKKKNTSRNKTAKPHKKALKGERAQARRREEAGGGRIFREDEDEKEERRKSCGHGCTERDSGCTSTCPFSTELRRVRDLWKQKAGGAGNTGRAASLPRFTTSDSVER